MKPCILESKVGIAETLQGAWGNIKGNSAYCGRGWRRKPCMGRGDDIEGNPALMVKKTLLGRRGMENETLVGPGGGWRRKPCIGEGEDVMK